MECDFKRQPAVVMPTAAASINWNTLLLFSLSFLCDDDDDDEMM